MSKKALLVGINDYAPAGSGGPDLQGCVNDVKDMALTLSGLGIVPAVPSAMHILTNAAATRAAIAEHLKWLVTGAKAGDTLVFYYSGHGTYVTDLSGDEPDHRDEAICPHDFRSKGVIIDDELRKTFAGLPAGANLEVILDSCYSGTATRELAPAGFTPRFVEPPVEHQIFTEATPSLPWRRLLRSGHATRAAVVVPGLNHVLWSGCADNQLSGEGTIGGVKRGFFTYVFCQALRASHGAITRRRLDTLVNAAIRQLSTSQTPQLEATAAEILNQVFK